MEREKITLTGAQETMLATLYARALDYRAPDPVLADRAAADAVERIDYDFARTRIKPTTAAGVAARGKQLDDWTREFLAEHPTATVLHLACGLDTRAQRMDPPDTVRWIDVDYPGVLDLRRRLLPEPAGDYRMVAASVTDEGWLEEVPADRPTVAVFEGLTMYLTKDEGRRLIQRITGRFEHGRLLFDCYGTVGIRLQKLVPAVRNAGATLHWGIDDPHELEAWHPGLRCLDALRSIEVGRDKMPRAGRIQLRVLGLLPGMRDVGRILRYAY
ncbi:class I SAM-dependent methyltransferase [Allonocardiopsis opalescens]|uniref:O-methyltransferase involved in polyketide biosynthesis n=1 Tax=Allonocardiopsis opalescens TaxID=1144618 RepID=A0A2T0Q1Y0_9ACTN|nr:class I SAM-dependent methyltransferase [Allonocardiopsis opalescens]PRX97805.1 O-methyltransferase involved in polyketide biosynthesis [Allonocardiopsis opalescens]